MDTTVARHPIPDMLAYEASLKARMVFAEGDDPRMLRAAVAYQRAEMGRALVVGREADVREKLKAAGLADAVREPNVVNAANTCYPETCKAFLFDRLQRNGHDSEYIHRLATRDRHVFSALMLQHGHGDGLATGVTRKSAHVLNLMNTRFDAKASDGAVEVTALLNMVRNELIADALAQKWPEPDDLATIAIRTAAVARSLGLEPRVGFVSFSTFGYPVSERATKMHQAPRVLDRMGVDIEYEGEMTVDVALNVGPMKALPFCRLTGPANILVVPPRHSANSTVNDILNMAVMAACKIGQ
jgi:malate dehydrogenase (oxaloacetate-decarboxylating)(NADP+)